MLFERKNNVELFAAGTVEEWSLIWSSFATYLTMVAWNWRGLGGSGPACDGSGAFQRAISGGPLFPDHVIANWVDDVDHGLFHGLISGFMIHFYGGPTHEWFPEAMLHDFLKCAGVSEEEHDALLSKFFRLKECAYVHTNPDDEACPLVIADRLELMRFLDWETWVHWEMLAKAPVPWRLVFLFYNTIRPLLKRVYEDRNDVWVRHVQEPACWFNGRRVATIDDGCWPVHFWSPSDDWFAVQAGAMVHRNPYHNNLFFAPNEGEDTSQFGALGLASMKTMRRHGTRTGHYLDHGMMTGRVPMDEWVFVQAAPVGQPCIPFGVLQEFLAICRHIESQFRFYREGDVAWPRQVEPIGEFISQS